jgi:Mrp family chromosome partitioning ATPase
MTPLDHAFIKAYGQDAESRSPASAPEREPVSLGDALAAGNGEPSDAVVATSRPSDAAGSGSTATGAEVSRKPPSLEEFGIPVVRLRRDPPLEDAGSSPVPSPHARFGPGGPKHGHARRRSPQPAWHVRSLAFPPVCLQLAESAEPQIERLCHRLQSVAAGGRNVIGLGSARRGAGCTTLVLCAAQRIAHRGLKTVLVEGDFADPQLAGSLGLAPEIGWEDVLAQGLPLAEGLVESTDDQLVVLPLVRPVPPPFGASSGDCRLIAALAELRESHGLVIVDLGALAPPEEPSPLLGRNLAADVIVVHDCRRHEPQQFDQLRQRLEAAGAVPLGVVENFVAG